MQHEAQTHAGPKPDMAVAEFGLLGLSLLLPEAYFRRRFEANEDDEEEEEVEERERERRRSYSFDDEELGLRDRARLSFLRLG